ncbi:hypothetical protein BCR34DRAFT_593682 [Clohesyomyces aquaticus]|uniref:Uncharacterized protein n=1 Tax=Clohesyomyces aquaticus TaxID=1231657 RepID=A0A1Y1YG54_9PLEO|nr:hypothetical protein BCR34DRAFT_593682 [Clohesyomyces aquaticus]
MHGGARRKSKFFDVVLHLAMRQHESCRGLPLLEITESPRCGRTGQPRVGKWRMKLHIRFGITTTTRMFGSSEFLLLLVNCLSADKRQWGSQPYPATCNGNSEPSLAVPNATEPMNWFLLCFRRPSKSVRTPQALRVKYRKGPDSVPTPAH